MSDLADHVVTLGLGLMLAAGCAYALKLTVNSLLGKAFYKLLWLIPYVAASALPAIFFIYISCLPENACGCTNEPGWMDLSVPIAGFIALGGFTLAQLAPEGKLLKDTRSLSVCLAAVMGCFFLAHYPAWLWNKDFMTAIFTSCLMGVQRKKLTNILSSSKHKPRSLIPPRR